MKKGRHVLGKVDYNRSGRRNCLAVITWELRTTGQGMLEFSACAEIWNPRGTDCYVCGQCVDEVAAYFPNDAKAQAILQVWRRWHLNGLRAGSPRQMEYLRENPTKHYETTLAALFAAGLQPDTEFSVEVDANNQSIPYSYGSAWLTEELPEAALAEIRSW